MIGFNPIEEKNNAEQERKSKGKLVELCFVFFLLVKKKVSYEYQVYFDIVH